MTNWKAVPVHPEKVTPLFLFEIAKRHRLLQENFEGNVDYYAQIAHNCAVVEVVDDCGGVVAQVFITNIVDGYSARIDFVPRPEYFKPSSDFVGKIHDAMSPVFSTLFEKRRLRRISAFVPEERNRTIKALRACGFKKEGCMVDEVKLAGKGFQNLIIMGLLQKKAVD